MMGLVGVRMVLDGLALEPGFAACFRRERVLKTFWWCEVCLRNTEQMILVGGVISSAKSAAAVVGTSSIERLHSSLKLSLTSS